MQWRRQQTRRMELCVDAPLFVHQVRHTQGELRSRKGAAPLTLAHLCCLGDGMQHSAAPRTLDAIQRTSCPQRVFVVVL